MAKRGREAALKRAREKARQDKQEAKREKQRSREDEAPDQPVDEQALMEEFARLSERHAANQISITEYDEERHRIFVELGIESDD
ncbi:MAG TPA: hypothetical protein VI141_02520 [Acidimicrobiia bacterium]